MDPTLLAKAESGRVIADSSRAAPMKLIIAIVQVEDTPALTEELVAAGHRFT